MAHKLVSDAMVEKAYRAWCVISCDGPPVLDDIDAAAMRAALEAVADEIRNQVIEECAREIEARHLQAWSAGAGSHTIRRLKSQGQ
jgi:hypothetical protein